MTKTTLRYAGFWDRVWAFAFDYLAITLYLIGIIILSVGVNFTFPTMPQTFFGNPVSAQIMGFFVITLPVTLYFALQESSAAQATWGKQRRQLRLIGKDGERLSRPHALGRTALKFIPWELAHTCIWQVSFSPPEPSPLITIGFILVWLLVGANIVSLLMSKTNQTIYDRLAGTYVVMS
jgi:uncharacterized RDD family membrane protein YckC